MRVDQVLPVFTSRDAIGVHTRNVQKALRANGFESEIYFHRSSVDVAALGHLIEALPLDDSDRIVLYHASTGSKVADTLSKFKGSLMVDYHNITPAKYFQQWDPVIASEVALGRRQLAQLAQTSIGAVADSAFNERELIDIGYTNTAVAPLLIDLEDQNRSVNNDLFETLTKDKSGASLLFVGTLAPHKAPHDLVALLLAYRELYDPNATLTLIGRPFEGRYATALAGYVKSLGLEKAVTITGSLPGPDLEAHWRTCDIFVCASNHEGFCVPLTEAMSHDVPIIAYGAAAIPETLGDAGLILDDKEPVTFAAGVHRVLSDDGLRHQLIAAGKQRLRIYDVAKATEAFLTGIHVVLTNASLTTRQEVSRRAN